MTTFDRRGCDKWRLRSYIVCLILTFGVLTCLGTVRVAADTEPNDDFATAELIAPGVHAGDLGVNPPTDGNDYYSLVLTANGQTVYTNVTIPPGGITGVIRLYNELQVEVSVLGFGGGTYPAEYTFAAAQTVYIRVELSGGSGTYSLQVAVTSQNDVNSGGDAGNVITGPTPVTPGTYPGCILKGEDNNDYYSLVLTDAGQTVYANVTVLPGGLTGALRLYDALQNEVWAGGVAPGTTQGEYTFATAQTIYIRVELSGGSGSYEMEIFATGVPIDQTPPTITHTPVTDAVAGQPVSITATVVDNVAVDKVYLNYTDVLAANHNVSMTSAGNTFSYDIPAQSSAGSVTYFIWANDTNDNEARTAAYTITVSADTVAPTITHTAVTSAKAGDQITITATITDNVGVQSATLYYRKTGDASYSTVAMSASGDTYTAVIPASAVTTAGIQYYISATDGTNAATVPTANPTTAPYSVSVTEQGGLPWLWIIIIIIVIVVVIALVAMLMRKKKVPAQTAQPPQEQTGP
jgi:hypothetical protein